MYERSSRTSSWRPSAKSRISLSGRPDLPGFRERVSAEGDGVLSRCHGTLARSGQPLARSDRKARAIAPLPTHSYLNRVA
jgi:hypothetical protein